MFNQKYQSLKFKRSKSKILRYKREITGVLFSAFFVILTLSLLSYNPTDRSWFYFTSKAAKVVNWCGPVGANLAAFIFYLFGSAAYIFLFNLLFISFILLFKKSFRQEWDRVAASVLFLLSSSAFLKIYNLDFTHSFAGGFFGNWMQQLVFSFLGSVGTKIAIISFILISVILFFRISFLKILQFTFELSYKFSALILISFFKFSKFIFVKIGQLSLLGLQLLWKKTKELCVYCFGKDKQKDDELFNVNKGQEEYQTPPFETEQEELEENVEENSKQEDEMEEGGHDFNSDFWDSMQNIANNTSCKLEDQFKDKLVFTKTHSFDTSIFQFSLLPNSVLNKNIFISNIISELSKLKALNVPVQLGKKEKEKRTYKLPDLNMFKETDNVNHYKQVVDEQSIKRGEKLEEKLSHFGIKGKVTAIRPGPIITLFEYKPEIDSKISKIVSLEDDLAMALTAMSIRIVAPIPGRSVIGFEISNQSRQDVFLSDIFLSKEFKESDDKLPIGLGFDIVGKPIIENLASMPHLLVAGSTGSGKSVGLNAMLMSLLCKLKPSELKLILIDPKRLEFAPYADIPHLLFPIVTNPRRAAPVLKWLVQEMEDRYDKMAQAGVRSISEYKKLCKKSDEYENMPFIILMIDELADLMMVAGKDVETQIARIAQMARAAGIHMIVATQRPSVDVVTGLIKVNFPSRIAFRVSSKIDSRTIIDGQGAEKLLGRGDMLYMNSISSDLRRIHGAYVSDVEIEKLTTHLRNQQQVQYLDLNDALQKVSQAELVKFEDELYPDIINFVKHQDEISISMIQRQYRIGFNRSARMIERLEIDGLIAPAQGSKPRKVIGR